MYFGIPLLYYYISLRSSLILPFFWRYISFFTYFCLIFNCLWSILWWVCKFISNSITIDITSCFCCLLNCFFWGSIKCICGYLFSMSNKFLATFIAYFFYLYFYQDFACIFNKRLKPLTFYKYSISWLNWIASHFNILHFFK